MTNKEILEKAIQKAIDGGWNTKHFNTLKSSYKNPQDSEFHDILGAWHNISPLDIIFNHDFAKALWPRKQTAVTYLHSRQVSPLDEWQYHLQQMVIAEDPIKYLGDNL